MKKLIAAITVSFMMLGLMAGCGEVKSFDGNLLEVISFHMSKPEILENAEKKLGKMWGMLGREKETVEDPMDAMYLDYRLDSLYGYKGEVMLTFEWNLRTLQEMGVFYEGIDSETAEQQYEDILNQFIEIYGQPYEDEYGRPMIETGESLIILNFQNYEIENQEGLYAGIYIYIVPNDYYSKL